MTPKRPRFSWESGEASLTRRSLMGGAGLIAGMTVASPVVASLSPSCSAWRQPNDQDFAATYGHSKEAFLDRVLDAIENEVAPKQR